MSEWGVVITAVAALIAALAGLVKAFQSSIEINDLKSLIKTQGDKIAALEKDNKELCGEVTQLKEENDELREQNKVVNAVNAELRKLLDGKMRRSNG